ncbi:MAG: class I SAM-dependent methyltransferase [Bacteroidota bacterium]
MRPLKRIHDWRRKRLELKYLVDFGIKYVNFVTRNEFENQSYSTFNERPAEYAFVFSRLAKYSPVSILDVGTGKTALPHLMRNCGFLVTAIDNIVDYWPEGMINRHYHVINDDITNTSLQGSFDMITCISTLEHISDYDRAVANMTGLLKPGGRLVLTFPFNQNNYCENVYDLPGSTAPRNMPFTTRAFSAGQVEKWCTDNRLTMKDQEFWRYFTGDFWTVGERLGVPERTGADQPHQISCLVLEKQPG